MLRMGACRLKSDGDWRGQHAKTTDEITNSTSTNRSNLTRCMTSGKQNRTKKTKDIQVS